MRLVQFELRNGERRVGVVEGRTVREVQSARSVRELALAAIEAGVGLAQQVNRLGLGDSYDYAALLADLKILPPRPPGPGAHVDQRHRPDPPGQCFGARQDAQASR